MIRRPLGSFSAIATMAAILVLAAGCGDREPVGVELRPTLKVGEVAHIVSAPTSAFAISRSAVIGPGGGMINFGIGSLTFPAGALSRPTTISATVVTSQLAVSFSPHGLTFPYTAQPKLSFDLTGTLFTGSRGQILYVYDDGTIGEILSATVDWLGDTATTNIQHFSTYAMGAH